VDRPGDVVDLIDDFIDTPNPSTQAVVSPPAEQPHG
jgi:hypothetical protein